MPGPTLTNPIQWNTVRAFSFVSDAAPVDEIVEIHTGEGKVVTLQNWVPGKLTNTRLSGGCGSSNFKLFSGDQATIGKVDLRLTSTGHLVNQVVAFHVSSTVGGYTCGPCTGFTNPGTEFLLVNVTVTAASAPFAVLICDIPNDPMLEGLSWYAQTLTVTNGTGGCGGGPTVEFTDGMRIYIGNKTPNCPQ